MKYNISFYTDSEDMMYYIIIRSDDLNYCCFYMDIFSKGKTLLEILKLNLNKKYTRYYPIEEDILIHEIHKEDKYISSYVNLTLDEVHSIILMHKESI